MSDGSRVHTLESPDEMALVDDLATVLSRTVVGWQAGDVLPGPLSEHPEVQRVMARYRAERSGPEATS